MAGDLLRLGSRLRPRLRSLTNAPMHRYDVASPLVVVSGDSGSDSEGTERTLKAARKPSRAVNVEAKTHMEAAAFLSHLADFYRHGVSWFSDAGSPAA